MHLFRPPVLRSATSLNRALFSKTVNIAAARVKDNKNIARFRKALVQGREILARERTAQIIPDPDQSLAAQGRKCILLDPKVTPDEPETWSSVLREAVKLDELSVVPYEMKLDYDYWSYDDIIGAILPEALHGEIPAGFNTVGHVAHLNLREQYLPYKKIIAEVLRDKCGNIRTVINKTENVGAESEFRTFNYEVLIGPDDLNVEVRENSCVFRFDYAKVYWNSKLEAEHTRLISLFKPGEIVCDVMAGIGPFAVPAGKKGVFVWANDMNPDSYTSLKTAIHSNKVSQFVRPFNDDGRSFISKAVHSVLEASSRGEGALVPPKPVSRKESRTPRQPAKIPLPRTISHFVMNLPASAISFVHHYRGIYAGNEELFAPHTDTQLPVIHVHCFALKSDDDVPLLDICERISAELGVKMRPGSLENSGEVSIHNVRDVAPAKRMFCASFRLPPEVAFASTR